MLIALNAVSICAVVRIPLSTNALMTTCPVSCVSRIRRSISCMLPPMCLNAFETLLPSVVSFASSAMSRSTNCFFQPNVVATFSGIAWGGKCFKSL